jgi:hypothetical protein
MISSLKIELNRSWKFRRNWNVPLVVLERSWWAGFKGIYLVRLGFRMWEIFIFKRFLPLKIQIKIPKNQVLEGKMSWGRGNTWPHYLPNETLKTFLIYWSKVKWIPKNETMTQKLKKGTKRSHQMSHEFQLHYLPPMELRMNYKANHGP